MAEYVSLSDIENAARNLQGSAVRTPLIECKELSERVGRTVFLKCENMQVTSSFKFRGAMNKISTLMRGDTRPTGVVTASSGNHGQAVAYAAKLAGLPCTVVVPTTVSTVKESAIVKHGAEVLHCGTMSNERIALAEQISKERGYVFVPPYDDPDIVAGQGTVGLEIAEDCPDVAALLVPVGGGGLLSGVSTAIKNTRPDARVIGVEPALANDTFLSFQAGAIREIQEARTIADGLRTSHPGNFTFPILQRYVDEIRLVEETDIEDAFKLLLQSAKMLVEPSGCVSVAALTKDFTFTKSGPIVCVLSGGNADLKQLSRLIME